MSSTGAIEAEADKTPRPFGRFYLRELINSGGMADIWFATGPNNEPYALRLLRDTSFFNFTAKRRFLRGCEVLSKIHNHENVIGYVEHGKVNGSLYLAMEYVEAPNLKQLFAQNDPVLVEHIGNILIDMAVGMEHVHDSGFMHLDFKPENVLVNRNGAVRLVDFDLAQPTPPVPQKMPDNPGTPAYMAPEQLLHQPIDQRVDIFAYGVTAYELLTGKKPFIGETPDDILRKQLDRSEFVPPRELNGDIPFALEKSILRCLEKEAGKRYGIASLLVHDLKSALYI